MSTENYGGMYCQGKTLDSSTRVFWQSYQHSHLVARQEEVAKEMMNFALRISLSYFEGFLTCSEIF
jgi:hypothetical protein